MTISCCMIIKNEAKRLPLCLTYAEKLFNEIIIVDTGSTDGSCFVAADFGAKIYHYKWSGDFAAARNYSLSHATSDWIFVLDADEVVAHKDHDAFRELIKQDNTVYSFVTRNYVHNPNVSGWQANDGVYSEQAGIGWVHSFKIRLFPNFREIKFNRPVHELVEASVEKAGLKIAEAPMPVHHYGKLDAEKQRAKGLFYYELGKQKLFNTLNGV